MFTREYTYIPIIPARERILCIRNLDYAIYGHSDALIESTPVDQRVASSNPTLAATEGPWASPSLGFAFGATLRYSTRAVVGSISE